MTSHRDVGTVCTRSVIFTMEDIPLRDAAELMRKHHVGSLVVVRATPAGNIVTGMLTDRDIAIVAVARDFDPQTLTVEQVMTHGAVTVTETEPFLGALQIMRATGARRLPVVSDAGILTGIVTLDDMLQVVVEELGLFVEIMRTANAHENKVRV